uniref:Uncharacterized protein n=1 Tax=Rhizophora mucronata TaxID=61149 RepID=A0A2P2QA68_RHIMU
MNYHFVINNKMNVYHYFCWLFTSNDTMLVLYFMLP